MKSLYWIKLTDDVTPRESILYTAAELITGDRNKTYGSPTQNFQDTARIWNVILRHKLGPDQELDATDVAKLMIGLKLARMAAQPKRDNWVHIAGYSACGYECGVELGKIDD